MIYTRRNLNLDEESFKINPQISPFSSKRHIFLSSGLIEDNKIFV